MRVKYHFSRLLKKYAQEILFYPGASGRYVNGEWVEGESVPCATVTGGVVPLSQRRILTSGGAYTDRDLQLFTLYPLDQALLMAQVEYKGNRYQAVQETDWSDYGDVCAYLLKAVGPFPRREQQV